MYKTDPYFIVRPDHEGKTLPYNPMYNYNFIKHYDRVDAGFLGSSAVNYFPIEEMYGSDKKVFSMGIESSNIYEHIAYGKVLAKKHPKEIVFFITFYALNPARGNQNYFHERVINLNNTCVDFFDQYFNVGAYKDALKCLDDNTKNDWNKEFNENGTRTQHSYLADTSYNSETVLSNYLAYMYLDPRYYASRTFEDPKSIEPGMKAIAEFCGELKQKGINIKLAVAPEHRLNMALIYYSGLGNTYEKFRKDLANIQPFYDLNLDTTYTSKDENFWDTHHVRKGSMVIKNLKTDTYIVTPESVDRSLDKIRPSQMEMERLKEMMRNYKDWKRNVDLLLNDLKITPAKTS